MQYSSGEYASAICQRCGLACDYQEVLVEWTGLRVCPACFGPKHPQLETPRLTPDAEQLEHDWIGELPGFRVDGEILAEEDIIDGA